MPLLIICLVFNNYYLICKSPPVNLKTHFFCDRFVINFDEAHFLVFFVVCNVIEFLNVTFVLQSYTHEPPSSTNTQTHTLIHIYTHLHQIAEFTHRPTHNKRVSHKQPLTEQAHPSRPPTRTRRPTTLTCGHRHPGWPTSALPCRQTKCTRCMSEIQCTRHTRGWGLLAGVRFSGTNPDPGCRRRRRL